MGRFFWLVLAVMSGVAHAQSVSFTFDDGFDAANDPKAQELNERLIGELARQNVRAMVFPAGRLAGGSAGIALILAWSRAGHAVGNHTFQHRNLNSKKTTLEEFIKDVRAAEAIFSVAPTWQARLRFPFLKEGDTTEKRDGVRAWMASNGYRAAPVSIDTSDWYYNQRYLQLQRDGRADALARLRQAYLEHLEAKALYYDDLAVRVTGRSPAHVMLMHANAINAACIGAVVAMFRGLGWKITSPMEAFEDPLYSLNPKGLPAGESIVWALARDANVAGLRYPAEDGSYEEPILESLGL